MLYHLKLQISPLQIRVDTRLHSQPHLACSIQTFTLISLAKVRINQFFEFIITNLAYEFAIDQIKKINNPELFEEQEEEEKTEEAPAEDQTEEAAEGAVEETPSQEPAAE